MRKKRLLYNTCASLTDELLTLVCGFILPKFFMLYYGSAVNGLISSITNFLMFIAFLDMGVGAVVQFTLYGPLAKKDSVEISKIMISAKKFFRKIAQILFVYVIILIIFYTRFEKQNFGYFYTASLIIVISINSFAQYYFGIVNQLLLSADQKSYIPLSLHGLSTLLNTLVCVILMITGSSIQFVKLMTSLIFLIRPLGMWLYVKRIYCINYRVIYVGEPIKQKWNGLAQHIAAVILDNTDTAVLTVFSTLENVSIYSVHYLVVNGIRKLIERFTTGMQALLGDIYARKEESALKTVSYQFEFMLHTMVTLLFTCTGILIIPFVLVYTKNITDANYYVPEFAVLLTISQAVYCIRIPYNMLVKAAGHYKQTQNSAIIEMSINIVLTLFSVIKFGLVGVAVGTSTAMLYRTCYLACYAHRVILEDSILLFVKHIFIDILSALLITMLCKNFTIEKLSYFYWLVLAIKVFFVSFIITALLNIVFNLDIIKIICKKNKE